MKLPADTSVEGDKLYYGRLWKVYRSTSCRFRLFPVCTLLESRFRLFRMGRGRFTRRRRYFRYLFYFPPFSVSDHHVASMCRHGRCRALVVQLTLMILLQRCFLSWGNSEEESKNVAKRPKIHITPAGGEELHACSVDELLPVELGPGESGGWVQDTSERTTAYDCSCPFSKAR